MLVIAPWLLGVALYLGCTGAASAQGGPPLITDDPGTPGNGHWEINTAITENDIAGVRVFSTPHIDLNYGLGDHIQLKYETGYLLAKLPGVSGLPTGFDDSLLGVKWRFLDQDSAGVDVSTYPQLNFVNSSGAVNRGLAERGTNLFLPVEVSHTFGRVSLDGEVGYQYLSSDRNQWEVGVVGAVDVTDKLELLTELHGSSETFLSRGDVIVDPGLRFKLRRHFTLLAAAGTGLRGAPGTTRLVAYLGFQWLSADE
jgi:hypothetical protein